MKIISPLRGLTIRLFLFDIIMASSIIISPLNHITPSGFNNSIISFCYNHDIFYNHITSIIISPLRGLIIRLFLFVIIMSSSIIISPLRGLIIRLFLFVIIISPLRGLIIRIFLFVIIMASSIIMSSL